MTRRPPAWQRGPDGQGSREHLHPGRRGLADVEIAQLTAHFLAHTLEVHGRYRTVVPDTVLEIAFDSIQPSGRHQSGYALRFPQIVRIRPDKTPAEIDTLETCRRLAAASFADASASREAAS